MRVVHLETGRHLYGGARQVLLLARGLKERGVEITLACTAGSAIAAEAARQGLAIRELAMHGDLDLPFVGRFTRLLRELRPDLVHVHSRRGADWLGGIAARRAGVRAVLTRRVDRPENRLVAAFRYRPYARVVAISAAIRAQLEASGLAPGRLCVIRSAVDPKVLEPAWSRERLAREFALDPRAELIGCVAQLIPRKGHGLLIESWGSVARAHPGARLLLFGQGPLEARLRQLILAAGLGGSVILAGYRADMLSFLARLDLLVHPALAEGLGLAVLEAQAAGVPVVAFRSGGVPEIVADGHTGCLVNTGDVPALTRAITELLGNPARRRALGEEARRRALGEFGVADMVSAHLTLYRDLIETGRR
jgi:glycosyltransferase involved in cell wall biosynthesis